MPSSDELLRFSYSAVSEWMHCRQRWGYRYRRGLIAMREDSRPMIGSAVHFAMGMVILQRGTVEQRETYNAEIGQKQIDGALDIWFEEQIARFEGMPKEQFDVIHSELSEYAERAAFIATRALDALNLDEWETVYDPTGSPMVEWDFEREVPGVGVLTGAIDWVARHRPTSTVWLWDHKIRGKLASPASEDFNTQMMLYQHVLEEDLNLHIAGSITFQVSSSLPRTPSVTKSGAMSRAAIDTDWATYRQAVVDAGLDPADYADMQEKLQGKIFYRPVRYYRSAQQTARAWNGIFVPAARQMREALYYRASTPEERNVLPAPPFIRHMSNFSCRGCEYATICLGEMRGHDMSFTEASEYRRRDTSVILAGDLMDPDQDAESGD